MLHVHALIHGSRRAAAATPCSDPATVCAELRACRRRRYRATAGLKIWSPPRLLKRDAAAGESAPPRGTPRRRGARRWPRRRRSPAPGSATVPASTRSERTATPGPRTPSGGSLPPPRTGPSAFGPTRAGAAPATLHHARTPCVALPATSPHGRRPTRDRAGAFALRGRSPPSSTRSPPGTHAAFLFLPPRWQQLLSPRPCSGSPREPCFPWQPPAGTPGAR
mmetsp:Transcript_82070/g.237957  ORF Transcript_82070/g.237957 Transcript_82070/m.237957 type:complete len:222 (-) Transcript_82070:1234-1899(-)